MESDNNAHGKKKMMMQVDDPKALKIKVLAKEERKRILFMVAPCNGAPFRQKA